MQSSTEGRGVNGVKFVLRGINRVFIIIIIISLLSLLLLLLPVDGGLERRPRSSDLHLQHHPIN